MGFNDKVTNEEEYNYYSRRDAVIEARDTIMDHKEHIAYFEFKIKNLNEKLISEKNSEEIKKLENKIKKLENKIKIEVEQLENARNDLYYLRDGDYLNIQERLNVDDDAEEYDSDYKFVYEDSETDNEEALITLNT